MCSVAINVLEPGAFNAESQYFIPLFNRFSQLCGQHPRGDEASNGVVQLRANRADFLDNANIWFLFFTMRIGPFSKCQNQFSWQFSSPTLTGRFSLRVELKIDAGFHSPGENRPTLIITIMYLGNVLNSLITKCKYLLYPKEGFQLCRKFSWR
jgi:hypothetical protein